MKKPFEPTHTSRCGLVKSTLSGDVWAGGVDLWVGVSHIFFSFFENSIVTTSRRWN